MIIYISASKQHRNIVQQCTNEDEEDDKDDKDEEHDDDDEGDENDENDLEWR